MALGIYLNATAGATNGTLEVAGDQSGIQLTNVGSVASFGLRCSTTNEKNSQSFTIPAPTDCQVSKDGITYGNSLTFAIAEIGHVNTLVYVKRTGATVTASTWTGIALSPRLALIGTSVNHAPAAFTPTVGSITANSAQVTFSTTDPDGNSLTYKVAVTTSATPPSDWSGYSNVTSPYNKTGLTEQTTYYAHVRATDGTLATVGTSASFQTGAATDTTAPTGPSSVSAAAGDAQATITYSGASDNVGVTNYDEYHTTHGGSAPTSGTTPSHSDVGSSPCVISGLTNGTAYDFWIRAKDAAGNKGSWVAASQNSSAGVTPVPPGFLNDFSAGQSIDSTNLGTAVSGSGAVNTTRNSNYCTCYAPAVADAAILYDKTTLARGTTNSRWTVKSQSTGNGFHLLSLQLQSPPTNGTTAWLQILFDGANSYIIYVDSSEVLHYWDWVNNTWATTAKYKTLSANTDYIATFECDANGWVFELKNGNGTTITNGRTAKVLWSNTKAGNSLSVLCGDSSTASYTGELKVSSFRREDSIGTVS